MLRNYFIVAWRNILRNRVFSLINISGLAIGLTVGLLIFQYVRFELSYDRFNANADRIYRIPIEYKESLTFKGRTATNHPALGPAMKADFPEVEAFARLVRTGVFMNTFTLSHEAHAGQPATFNETRVYLADASLLDMFAFPLLAGDAASALKEPNCIVLSESSAYKYFGGEPALGKTLSLNRNLNLKVTGIMKDLPPNSHLQFDILLSFATLGNKFGEDNWGWPEFYNYVRLTPGTDPKTVEAKFPAFIDKYLGAIMKEYNFRTEFSLQPITSIHLDSHLELEQDVNGSSRTVYFLVLLAVFVLVVAWINYINLSTAKSLERSKEVGLRKVAGASKKQLVVQFFMDALLMNTLAVLLALLLLSLATPYFESIVGKPITSGLHLQDWQREIMFILPMASALLTGTLFVGLYPALLVSSFNPAAVLKGNFHKSPSSIMLRQGLVSFQYILSIFLIGGSIAIYQQLQYLEESDPGYAKNQMLILRSPSVYDSTISIRMRAFEHALAQIPTVAGIAASDDIPGQAIGGRNTVRREGQSQDDDRLTYLIGVSRSFFETYNIPLAAGRTFEDTDDLFGNAPRVLINEEICTRMGFKSPGEAIGSNVILRFGQGPKVAEVIGVVKNYHQRSLKDSYSPILYFHPNGENWNYLSIRLTTRNLGHALSAIRNAYDASFPYNAFDYFFLDDHFSRQYQSDRRFGTIFGVFTTLAIIIACLGLFGLSIFAVTQRTKEVGIRKVLGASVTTILALFSKDSVKLVLISYSIAVPLIYLAVGYWLSGFAFHISPGWAIFLLPPLLLLAISIGTIVVVCLRAALSNPTRALRHE